MSSLASCAANKHAKLDVSCIQPQPSTVSVSPCLILSTIGHIFEAIDLVDKFDCGQANPTEQVASKRNVRAKLYSALGALRTMAPSINGMHINQLPDDCLSLIFGKRFSLESMKVTLRSVCHRWKTVVENTFSTQRSLKLFSDPGCTHAHELYTDKLILYNLIHDEELILKRTDRQHHDLILPSSWAHEFDPVFFNSLGGLFGNLQHLVLCVQADSFMGDQKELGQMIAQWPHLTRLTLFIDIDLDDTDSEEVPSFTLWLDTFAFQAINSLSSLKHFDLFGDVMLFSKDVAAELDKVLPQLEHLSLRCTLRFMDFNLDSFLAKLGQNLKSLRFFRFYISDDTLKGNFQRLALNITELRLTNVNEKIFNFICEHFRLLKTLEMNFGSYVRDLNALDYKFIFKLNRLSHLESLSLAHLYIDLDSTRSQVIASSPIRSLQLANLAVKPLGTDGVLFVKTLKQMFPHLEQLDYQYSTPITQTYPFVLNQLHTENYFRTQFSHLAKSRFTFRYYAYKFYDVTKYD